MSVTTFETHLVVRLVLTVKYLKIAIVNLYQFDSKNLP